MRFYIRNVDFGSGREDRFEAMYGEDLKKFKLRRLVSQEKKS